MRRGNASKQRWIDNYSHRIDGGTVHVRNFRFGGEGKGIPALVNFAPYACEEVMQTPNLETEMCGRLNRSGPIATHGVRGSGGSSIVIEGSVFASGGASPDIVLEEIPSLLVLRDNWNQDAADFGLDQACREPGGGPCYKMVGVADALDLDGPYLDVADRRGVRARPVFRIETTYVFQCSALHLHCTYNLQSSDSQLRCRCVCVHALRLCAGLQVEPPKHEAL